MFIKLHATPLQFKLCCNQRCVYSSLAYSAATKNRHLWLHRQGKENESEIVQSNLPCQCDTRSYKRSFTQLRWFCTTLELLRLWLSDFSTLSKNTKVSGHWVDNHMLSQQTRRASYWELCWPGNCVGGGELGRRTPGTCESFVGYKSRFNYSRALFYSQAAFGCFLAARELLTCKWQK